MLEMICQIASVSPLLSTCLSLAFAKSQIMAALAAPKRKQVQELEKTIDKLEQQLSNMGPIPKAGNEAAWIELARALFSFKEFVYLK